ncbi:MAG: D-alanyl-D-alanine carboxypeptidase [Candidatus Pacebacteria bacterium]|nr:D-alanyl-D-alanine carboxypeptidase [Candidatus Paceibacterota bacterium]
MKKINRDFILKMEWVACLLLGFSLFFLPNQNCLIVQATPKKNQLRQIDFDWPLSYYPVKKTDLAEPILTASGAAILDRDSGVFLFEKNYRQHLLPASTVKIMTALISLKHYSPLEVLMVPEVSDEGQDMGLVEGELITVEALLNGLLIASANDAAEVLANNYSKGRFEFIGTMNQEAGDLGLKNTFYDNPTGLDNEVAINGEIKRAYTSAQDLAWLTDVALKNEIFAKIVATRQVILKDPQGKFFHPLSNLNELLWTTPGVVGVKTGWTEEARECLVTFFKKDGHQLIVVVLGSEDRFGESRRLIDWALENFSWQEMA